MADRKGRKEPVQTIGTARSGKQEVTPLRPTGASSPKTAAKANPVTGPTDEQIAERAWALWVKGGYQPGQDRENWFEAERQLKKEMGIK